MAFSNSLESPSSENNLVVTNNPPQDVPASAQHITAAPVARADKICHVKTTASVPLGLQSGSLRSQLRPASCGFYGTFEVRAVSSCQRSYKRVTSARAASKSAINA